MEKRITSMINFKLGLFFLGVFIIGGCQKEDTLVSVPSQAHFVSSEKYLNYYVTSAATDSFVVEVGTTDISNSDRTVTFSISSPTGAVQGTQYTIISPSSGNTITIPAGQSIASIKLHGIFSAFPGTRKDTLVFTLSQPSIETAKFNDTLGIVMQKFCNVVLADLGGNFTANEYLEDGSFSYGPYASGVVNLTSTGATTASGAFVNLFDYGWNDINFTMDWKDPANLKINIPVQATGATNAGGNFSYVRGTTGKPNTNIFSSCDQTYSIAIDLMTGPTTVAYSGYQIRLMR